jgi:hypothetical protein
MVNREHIVVNYNGIIIEGTIQKPDGPVFNVRLDSSLTKQGLPQIIKVKHVKEGFYRSMT